jgi:phosphatidate cytidylyltransferase
MRGLSGSLSLRVATAAATAPVVLAAVWLGGWWLEALVFVVAGLAGWEWGRLAGGRSRLLSGLSVVAAVAFPLSVALNQPGAAPALLVGVIALGLILLPRGGLPPGPLYAGAAAVLGAVYAGALLAPALILNDRPDGRIWLLVIIIGTWACDTGAYAVGRLWGRHALASTISPAKTKEGTAGGLVAAVVVGVVAGVIVPSQMVRLVILGAVVGISAVVGDLLESAAKRRLRVKDSGWIMPGHGGILDRIDSLLLAMMAGYIFVAVTD